MIYWGGLTLTAVRQAQIAQIEAQRKGKIKRPCRKYLTPASLHGTSQQHGRCRGDNKKNVFVYSLIHTLD